MQSPMDVQIPSAVKFRGITKTFGHVVANNVISLDIQPGKVHALLGENGAGKTTLMNILYGFIQPDQGAIEIHGKSVEFSSPADAYKQKIAMVHQRFMLIPRFTVIENIVLGLGTPGGLFLDTNQPIQKIEQLSETYGLKIDLLTEVAKLSVGEQQRVEIIKAFYRNADILILDEPTSVLTPQEVEQLFKIIRTFTKEGHTVIFISHKLNEVLAISDFITVLRDGRLVATLKTKETSKKELAMLMVGREVFLDFGDNRPEPANDVALQVTDLWVKNDRGLNALSNVSFNLNKGEILAVAGVDGNGQQELAETLLGLIKSTKGKIILEGEDITNQTPGEAIKRGITLVPADRRESALLGNLPLWRNIILGSQNRPPIVKGGLLQTKAINLKVNRLLKQFDVRPADPDWIAISLSGGNQQKLVLARQLDLHPRLLIVCQPTLGLDISTTEYVRGLLLKEKEKGTAILLISTDLQEVLSLSDRLMVLYEGKVMGTLKTKEAEIEHLGLMMAGVLDATQMEIANE